MLELHPEAAKNINSKAEALLSMLKRGQLTKRHHPTAFPADRHVKATLTDDDITGEFMMSDTDEYGRTTAKYFQKGPDMWRLGDEGYEALKRIGDLILRNPKVNALLSSRFVADEIFNWCRSRHRDGATANLFDYLCKRASEEVKARTAWVPIAFFDVQHEFEIGRVAVRPISRKMIDAFEEQLSSERADASRQVHLYFEKLRGQIQGNAAIVCDVTAEPQRTEEIAFELADDVVGMLRLFSPAAFDPGLVCPCAPMGTQYKGEDINMLFVEQNKFAGARNSSRSGGTGPWRLHADAIATIKDCGLDEAAMLLALDEPNEFQRAVLRSHLLYSRSLTKTELSDRLVYMLTALESVFLKDSSEPIQHNLADRLAFCTAHYRDDRARVIENTKRIYSLRSRYLHHAASISDLEALRPFLMTAFEALQAIRKATKSFTSVSDFCRFLDDVKLGGSSVFPTL